MSIQTQKDGSRGFLVGLDVKGKPGVLDVEDSLEELALLADTAGVHVVGQTYQRVSQPDPATFIRSGKVEEVAHWVKELGVDTVIFDDELSPRHQRELEKIFGEDVKVLDRTALILDIFAQHAHTREGALQVALAQYEYRLPRLTLQWTHLARQAGGGAIRGGSGGVGLRGPGETQLETDRREIRRRIAALKEELEGVRAHRERHRAQRRRAGIPVIALVGYTNAGKSTLLNRLSQSDVYVADQLFATLDPTTRRVSLSNGRDVLFTDTVGFIQKLPTSLVAAFRATLEEINEADLLLHVADASHPNVPQHIKVVEDTLRDDLNIRDIPILMVFNKVDLTREEEPAQLDMLREQFPEALFISALNGSGIDSLLEAVENALAEMQMRVVVRLPYSEGALISRFYELAIVEKEAHTDEYTELTGTLDREHVNEYQPYIVENT
ncbi:MAG TPA: GTPase HflX [Aggregatilineales bacterium]|nr:GTPase HflX [Aggregatilineales bacterium]